MCGMVEGSLLGALCVFYSSMTRGSAHLTACTYGCDVEW